MSNKISEFEANCIAGIDIGRTTTQAIICHISADQSIQILGAGSSMTKGLTKGEITDATELKGTIDRALSRAQFSASISPKSVITNIPDFGIQFAKSTGICVRQEQSEFITSEDKSKAIGKAKQVIIHPSQTIVHAMPVEYKVDGASVEDPVGIEGHHVEANCHFLLCAQAHIKSLQECYAQLGLHISGIVHDSLALQHVLLMPQERQEGAVIVDIGGQKTTVSVIRNNVLDSIVSIPIGGETITNDIQICLKVKRQDAERLKIIYGNTCVNQVSAVDMIQISTEEGQHTIKRRLLCQIIEARVEELLKLIRANCPEVMNTYNSIALTGDGALLTGLPEFIRKRLGRSVRHGLPNEMSIDQGDETFPVALGAIFFACASGAITYKTQRAKSAFKQLFGLIKP